MNCSSWTAELVEHARAGFDPGAELAAHLQACSTCRERWEDQRSVSEQLRALRAGALARPRAAAGREQIMRQFALAHRGAFNRSMVWALSAAAALVLAVALGYVWPGSNLPVTLKSEAPIIFESYRTDDSDVDFVPIPYAPPLAAGEFVKVVRMELYPAALARMGLARMDVDVDAAYAAAIPVDVLLGEDGFPRGVRVSGDLLF